jgi:hypothetical protein
MRCLGATPRGVELAQIAAYESGEDAWDLVVPPEDYGAGLPYRLAGSGEVARTGRGGS